MSVDVFPFIACILPSTSNFRHFLSCHKIIELQNRLRGKTIPIPLPLPPPPSLDDYSSQQNLRSHIYQLRITDSVKFIEVILGMH